MIIIIKLNVCKLTKMELKLNSLLNWPKKMMKLLALILKKLRVVLLSSLILLNKLKTILIITNKNNKKRNKNDLNIFFIFTKKYYLYLT